MRINNNIMAMNTHRQLGINSTAGGKSVEKLSSGFRINRAGDDAAGLAISEKMRGQIRGLSQASRNAQDGISLIQTAEGALNETHAILQRMRELSVQASNGTSTNADKGNIQAEVNQLISEVDRIANDTEFNTKKLLNGDMSETAKFATFINGGTSAGLSSVSVSANATAAVATISGNTAALAADNAAVWRTGVLSGAGVALANDTKLTALEGSADDSLGIQVGDEITVSAVVAGQVKNSVYVVTKDSTLQDFMGHVKNTLGASDVAIGSGITAAAAGQSGVDQDTVATSGIMITGQTGADNEISSIRIDAVSSNGIERTAFEAQVNKGINSGLSQVEVAGNAGDLVVSINADGVTGVQKGDVRVAAGGNRTVQAANMTMTFNATGPVAGGNATITVASRDQSAAIQIGANEGQTTDIAVASMDATALGLKTNGVNLSVMTNQAASTTITKVNDAISTVSTQRAKLGAIQNRLEHTIKNLDTSQENLQASESRIRDVDMAKEMMEFTKNNILQQAAQAMLAQANQAPQGVLQLLR